MMTPRLAGLPNLVHWTKTGGPARQIVLMDMVCRIVVVALDNAVRLWGWRH